MSNTVFIKILTIVTVAAIVFAGTLAKANLVMTSVTAVLIGLSVRHFLTKKIGSDR